MNKKKKPVLLELSPDPSVLYVYVNPVPGTGADSKIEADPVIELETISKFRLIPPTDLPNWKIGRSNWFELNVYTSVLMPPTVPDSRGFPKSCPVWFAALRIAVNCSL